MKYQNVTQFNINNGSVAQLEELLRPKEWVIGSNPVGITK